MAKKKLNQKQKRLVNNIMKENDRQRKVDKIVENTKKAMEICQKESQQAKVDKIVSEQLAKM